LYEAKPWLRGYIGITRSVVALAPYSETARPPGIAPLPSRLSQGSPSQMLPDPKTTLSHATEKAWTLLDEFKAFAFKGNVVDLAIGVIIGGVFHNLIDSLVKNLIMPLIAILIPGQRPYTHWQITVRGSTVHIGLLLGDIAHFLLISAILFLFLMKFLGWLMRPKKLDEAAPALSRQEELLTEIRDLLKVPRERST
jgi:large conductance mechanosensitive channel